MKSICIVLSSILCSTSPLLADSTPKPQSEFLGETAISRIRADYQAGSYDELLSELDDAYKLVQSESQLAGLADMRLGSLPDAKEWEQKGLLLQKEKSAALLSALTTDDAFAQKVKSAASSLTPEEEQAWSLLSSFHSMAPTTGKSPDENRLIDLDLEYEFKAIRLDMPLIEGQPIDGRKEKQIALRMQKMDRLLEASKSFEDASLKTAIQLASQSFDRRLAQNWDMSDLMALVKKRKLANAQEEKIASVLSSYQQKHSDLTKQFLEQAHD